MIDIEKEIYVYDEVWANVRRNLWEPVWDNVSDNVRGSIWDNVWGSVEDTVARNVDRLVKQKAKEL
jgi:hypothetical protein